MLMNYKKGVLKLKHVIKNILKKEVRRKKLVIPN